MFEQAKYIQNSFSINFQKYKTIRRKANEFEDLLKERFNGHYGHPQVISIPDELDPEVPRMIFGSKHGFSQIIISQISMTLNVTYSPDWQIDITKGKQYLKERSLALFSLLEMLEHMEVYFSGLTTRVQVPIDKDDTTILHHLQNYCGVFLSDKNIHDLQVKITKVHDDIFYNNITVQNYRTWSIMESMQGIPRLSRQKVSQHGLEILGDFNDRFAFNEQEGYLSSSGIATRLIDEGLAQVSNITHNIIEG